jgi:immune inhibitor A
MKKTINLILLLMISIGIQAVPAKRGTWKAITLSDGTQVKAELCGDEYGHYYKAADGKCYTQSGSIYQSSDESALSTRASVRRVKANVARRTRSKVGGVGSAIIGNKKGLIILVQFTDTVFQSGHNQAFYNNVANTEGFTSSEGFKGSVNDYFKAQSNGQFSLNFDVVGPVTLSNKSSYYGANDTNGNDMYPGTMVAEACQAVDSQVDFSNYDWDGDGSVDQVFVLYAGPGEANGGDASTVWPHEWTLSESDYGKSLTLDGKTINTYACSCELQPATTLNGVITSWKIDGPGTICHEFSHCLGFPDMYDTTTNGSNFGMDEWDLMDYGCYLGNGFTPCNYTSYERWVAGWKTPIVLSKDTTVTNMASATDYGDTYVIYNDQHKDEFYLLENRQKTSWDAYLPGSGLLVLHVDYNATVWANNEVNNTASHQRCTVIHADNSAGTTASNLAGDPYPYLSNDSLTNKSTPAALLFNNNTDGTKYMNKSLKAITRNSDGTMAFNFANFAVPVDPTAADTLFHETFNQCAGTGGNDGKWSGTIARATFIPDVEGWESETSMLGGDQCGRFGTGTTTGIVYSPDFTLSGTANVDIVAAPWGSDGTSLDVYLCSGTGDNAKSDLIDSYTIAAQQWTSIAASITGTGGTYYLAFVPDKRLFLDDVKVYIPGTAGIKGITTTEHTPADGRIYSIDGQYMGKNLQALKPGLYIINGKKIVK